MKRVATFSRVSTEMESQRTSIENQEDIYKSWIMKHKFSHYKSYIDDGISGTKAYKRVQWLAMLEDGKNKKYDILLCKSYSRFGRNMIETLSAIKSLREVGIRIVFLEDSLDSEADSSKFGLFSWISEQESQNTSKRIKMVFEHFKETGKMYNCIPPYGYEYSKEEKNFVVNEDEAEVVRRVFKLYSQGNGVNKIATILENEGVKSKNGGKWRANTIKNMITNEAYLGTLVQNKTQGIDVTIKAVKRIAEDEWVKHYDNHESIIDKKTFIEVNKIFKNNSERAKNARGSIKIKMRASNTSLFSNLLKCQCESTMTIKRKKNRKPYYNCNAYERIGTSCGHQSNFTPEEDLVKFILVKLNRMIENNFDDIKIENVNDVKITLQSELISIQKQIDKQIILSNNLLKLYSEGTISAIQFKLQNESLGNTLNSLMKNKESVEENLANIPHDNTNLFKKSVEEVVKIPISQWNNAMLKEVINKIVVYFDGRLEIEWNVEKM